MVDRFDELLAEVADRVASRVIERLGDRSTSPTSIAPLLSKQQLAAQLGISVAGVDRLVRDVKIPFLRVGDVRRFDFAVVRAALERAEPEKVPRAATAPATAPAPVRLLKRGSR